jgi:hypothetical protein
MYFYTITVSLAASQAAGAFLAGRWAPDDVGRDILINGVSTGATAAPVTGTFLGPGFTPFPSSLGLGLFIPGENTVSFRVANNGPGPTGVQVDGAVVGPPREPGLFPNVTVAATVDPPLSFALEIAENCQGPVTYTINASEPSVVSTGSIMIGADDAFQTVHLTILGPGATTLSTTNDQGCEDYAATITVHALQFISMRLADAVMLTGAAQQAIVQGIFGPAGPRDVSAGSTGTTYTVQPSGVVEVSEDGLVSAVGPGFVQITVTNGGSPAFGFVTVIGPQSLGLELAEILEVGDREQAVAIAGFGPLGQTDVTAVGTTYTVDPTDVVEVSADGLVTALATGTAEITAMNSNLSATATVTVVEQITKIAFLVGNASLNPADRSVVEHLRSLTFTGDPGRIDPGGLPPQVQVFDDDDIDAPALDARFDLLISSSTVNPGAVGGNFRCLSLPHVFWERQLNQAGREGLTDDHGTTPATFEEDGVEQPVLDFFVLDNTHPITQGLPVDPEIVTVYDSGQVFFGSAGNLAPGATVLADTGFTDTEGAPIWAIVVADTDAQRVDGGPILGRRVSLFFNDSSFDKLNETGLQLFDNSVDWALAGERRPCDSAGVAECEANDCNGNGVPDACDIDGDLSSDANRNGIPDECEVDLVPPALVVVMGGLGRAADEFISPLGENVPFDTAGLTLTTDVELAAPVPGLTLTSDGNGEHTLTLDTPVTPGQCQAMSFDVRDLASGATGTISITLCHQPLDINQDRRTNIADATAFGNEFGGAKRAALIDTNGDGVVNVQDATAFGNNWIGGGTSQPWANTVLP